MIKARVLAASLAASLAFAADAMAASQPVTEAGRIASQYSEWAGGKSNADSIVAGMRNGQPITIVTNSADRSVSIAGFTPAASMTYSGVGNALMNAQRSLAKLGITKPSAEQIQAALIGGEVTTSAGATTTVKGSVSPKGPTPVASR